MPTRAEGTNWVRLASKNFWQGVATFATSDSTIQGDIEYLIGSEYPGFTGENAPCCKSATGVAHPGGSPEIARIEAQYETKRVEGKARVFVQLKADEREMKIDLDGKVVEGPDPTQAPGHFYKVVEGSNKVHDYESIIRVETAYPMQSFQLGPIYSLRKAVNDAALTLVGFGTMDAGTVLCLGVGVKEEFGGELAYIDYYLAYSGTDTPKWNERCKSQLGVWMPQKRLSLNEDGTVDDDAERTVMAFVLGKYYEPGTSSPIRDIDPEARRLYREASFNVLQGLTQW
jgi:hypothetical protein